MFILYTEVGGSAHELETGVDRLTPPFDLSAEKASIGCADVRAITVCRAEPKEGNWREEKREQRRVRSRLAGTEPIRGVVRDRSAQIAEKGCQTLRERLTPLPFPEEGTFKVQ